MLRKHDEITRVEGDATLEQAVKSRWRNMKSQELEYLNMFYL